MIDDARKAIDKERRAHLTPVELRVVDAEEVVEGEDHGVWRLRVETDAPMEDSGSWVGLPIERQLVDASATDQTPAWRAEILEVDADTEAVFVAANAPWPGPGRCRVRPFDFLAAPSRILEPSGFEFLHGRLRERLALAAGGPLIDEAPGPPGLLPAWYHRWSLLWGPPGTGKTHTIVEQVAMLLTDPAERVLVVSTTNRATDEVALRLGQRLRKADRSLDRVWRMGRVVRPEDYERADLSALLPPQTAPVLRALRKAHARLAELSHARDRSPWIQEILDLERALPTLSSRATDRQARCLLATLHAGQRAIIDREVLAALEGGHPPFTTVIVDEAGLVPRVLAATLSLLASRRVVLVGDPRQLSPIARATRSMPPEVMTWVARSALDHLADPQAADAPHVHRLDVQRRMHPAIREVVSTLSYDGRLTDGPGIADRPWPRAGALAHLPRAAWYVLDAHHPDRPAEVASRRGPAGRSRMRPIALDVLDALLDAHPNLRTQDALLITPFRAQRDQLHGWVQRKGLTTWRASTVHAQQGAEADWVVFDTVHASSTSWPSEEWVRLINVGMSRARHGLLVLASRAEMAQPFLRPVRTLLPPRALVPRGDRRAWTTLDRHGKPRADTSDLFSEPAPVAAEPLTDRPVAPPPSGPSLGAQLARRRALRPVLSHEQARLVHRDLSDAGPRLVRGVAGSGKTLVLAHWAVRALRGLAIPRVTVVYANKALRPLLEHLFAEAWREAEGEASSVPWRRVTLVHIADLLHGLLQEHGLPLPDRRDRFAYEDQAERVLAGASPEPRFDALFIDEAQDLGHTSLRLAIALVRPQPDGLKPVLVFFDNAQNVYGRRTPRWRDLGLDLRGRADVMRESFRSTRAATELALGVLDRLRPLHEDPDLKELMRPHRPGQPPLLEAEGHGAQRRWHARFCAIEGQPPAVRVHADRDAEVDYVVAHVTRWVKQEGVAPDDLCVISNHPAVRAQIARGLRAAGVPAETRTTQGFVGRQAIAITTAHSFKGYDAELVVVAGADTFATARGPLYAPLYVAMTRARTGLLVTATRPTPGSSASRVVDALEGAIATL